MNISRIFGLCLALGMLGLCAVPVHADDIDIYSETSGALPPNVLLILDNAANFSAAVTETCAYDGDNTKPTLLGTAGGIEQCALYNVIKALPFKDGEKPVVNVGVMVYNDNNIRDWDVINKTAGENCRNSNGGCLVYPIVPLTPDNKQAFLDWVKSWRTDASTSGGFYMKAAGEATGAVMQEAWAYYAGKTGLSGRPYTPPSPGCQKNFVIFVGNAYNQVGTPGDGANSPVLGSLKDAGANTEQLTPIQIKSTPFLSTTPQSCGTYTMGNHTESSGLYADEWARFMAQTDIYGSLDENQSIKTYTVGYLGATCKPDYPALMDSMAYHGNGTYYAASSYKEIANAMLKILNEIQSENSAFASASLPVSVNAQGTYLNQIFLGMFRPDKNGTPRWLGNLKQYQFILKYDDPLNPDPNKATLLLGDANGAPAISNKATGFIASTARSFWTTKNLLIAPDSTGGFFKNDSHGEGGGYDSPDGDLVEKGGAAQVLRKSVLAVDYATTPRGPRKLYTYCPGATCSVNLTDAGNSFATDNTALVTALQNKATQVIPMLSVVKSSGIAIATTTTPHGLSTGDIVTISGANEAGYNGTVGIAVGTNPSVFAYNFTASGSIASAATGNITVTASFPKRLINWVRGEDNFRDEKSPGSPYNVRPSVHGDVVHSRPVVINYSTDKLVVFYGGNDGVFRAVNGSQTTPIGSVPPGGELWGLVLPEHYGQLNRQRTNSPELKLPSTALPGALPKDYFVDGSPGVYQQLDADFNVVKAMLYLTMRRGGRFIYALDVTDPTAPKVAWRIRHDDPADVNKEFAELGQSWSRPRLTLLNGYVDSTKLDPKTGKPMPRPVLVFGGGYDAAEDAEPPNANTMGRGIYIVDAETGKLVWKATYGSSDGCSASGCTVSGMKWSIPADITFLDRDNDGRTDRLYAADVGGNVWRVDFEANGDTPDKWRVVHTAALGCGAGSCPAATTPRKFFYPPNVVMVGVATDSKSFDAVLIGSGDREHPLVSSAAGSSHLVENHFYMLKDAPGKDGTVKPMITMADLFDATVTAYRKDDTTYRGFFVDLPGAGEKVVNASVTTRGSTFFGTNQPQPPSPTTCKSNLGKAVGYQLDPFTGERDGTVFDGGGLPPSPIVGIVNINKKDGSGTVQKEFCIGCGGGSDADSKSALGAGDLTTHVPKNLRRTYWYKK